ncbi:hypothetical protein C4559_05195 [Candidatus Microgenomates bacterium]|nr:MAG: hypothetical protein C4559_05195 [Candidatus Microgenomates bacterium]
MNDDSTLKKGLGGIGDLGKQLGEGIVKEAKKSVKTAAGQVGFEQIKNKEQDSQSDQFQQQKAKDNDDLVKAMYGKSEIQNSKLNSDQIGVKSQNSGNEDEKEEDVQAKVAQKIAQKHPEMSPEEVQKMAGLRQQLHREYYEKLSSPSKQQEERPVEKLEREEQEERWELQEKEKKKPKNLAIEREQTKAERRVGSG